MRIPRNDYPFSSGGKATFSFILKVLGVLAAICLVGVGGVGWYWDTEPRQFEVTKQGVGYNQNTASHAIGTSFTGTVIKIMHVLLNKRGGYLSNDEFPPGAWMDNIPNWEFGALTEVRDAADSVRDDFSRSESESAEDSDVASARAFFYEDHRSWIIPPAEERYSQGIEALQRYQNRLAMSKQVIFFGRADDLSDYLARVEKRLGGLSQKLGETVHFRYPPGIFPGSVQTSQGVTVENPWFHADDFFYEARGSTWALLHLMKAVQIDFDGILRSKHALELVGQIIQELESTQHSISSPILMRGDGWGWFPSYCLALARYIDRTVAKLQELRELLKRG